MDSLHAAPVPTVVVSDFGRDAALRFCQTLAHLEAEVVTGQLPEWASFFDEYRRIALHVVGDLRFVKEPWLAVYARSCRPFDERVLVGFPGGPPMQEVIPRIGRLVVEALAGPVLRGAQRAVVALPCNTLAPVSWALRDAFASHAGLVSLLESTSSPLSPIVDAVLELEDVAFPTVPEAVLQGCRREGVEVVVPLGTPGIVKTYERAAERVGHGVQVAAPEPGWQSQILEAIGASIAADPARRQRSGTALADIRQAARLRWGPDVALVEACTDLDYGIGVDSGEAYARYVVEQVYGTGRGEG